MYEELLEIRIVGIEDGVHKAMEPLAAAFVAYTVGAIGANLAFGPLIDKYGARRLLPYYLYPLVLACLTIVFLNHPLSAVALTLFLGLTSGSGQTLVGAAWPEFYGALNLGAIRAMVMSMSVGASALSPFVLGWLIDRGASMESMAVGFLVYLALAIAGIMAALAVPGILDAYRPYLEGVHFAHPLEVGDHLLEAIGYSRIPLLL